MTNPKYRMSYRPKRRLSRSKAGERTIRVTVGTEPVGGGWRWVIYDQDESVLAKHVGTPWFFRVDAMNAGADYLRKCVRGGK